VINLKRCPKRKIENTDADGLQRIGKNAIPTFAEALAPQNDRNAGEETNYNAR